MAEKWLLTTLTTPFLCWLYSYSFLASHFLNNRKIWFKWLKKSGGSGSGECCCTLNPKLRSGLSFLTQESFWLEIAVMFACYHRHSAALFPPTGALSQVPWLFTKLCESILDNLRLFITLQILLQLGCMSAADKLVLPSVHFSFHCAGCYIDVSSNVFSFLPARRFKQLYICIACPCCYTSVWDVDTWWLRPTLHCTQTLDADIETVNNS